MSGYNDIMKMVLSELSDKYSEVILNLWFGDVELVFMNDKIAVFTTKNTDFVDILNTRYAPEIATALENAINLKVDCHFFSVEKGPLDLGLIIEEGVLRKDAEQIIAVRKNQETEEENQTESVNLSDIPEIEEVEEPSFFYNTDEGYNKDYTFENFIVGESNKFAHAAAYAVASENSMKYNPLFIRGPSGIGKTHLLYAIINEIRKNNPKANIVYIKGEEFTNQLIDSISKKTMDKFREKYRKADVLLVDDIQFIAGRNATQEEFFHTFNALYEANKQIVLTSDRPPRDIKTLEERLQSRFEWGLIADIQAPDLELRCAILKRKASDAGVSLSNEVIYFMAEHIKNNVRQIEGAIKKLGAVSSLNNIKITVSLARLMLADLIVGAEPPEVTIERIFSKIEKKYNISKEEIIGKGHKKEVALARHIFVYVVKTVLPDYSYPDIGKILSRHHSTIIASFEVIRGKMEDPIFDNEIKDLIKEIKQ